jgi:hypothetical protein
MLIAYISLAAIVGLASFWGRIQVNQFLRTHSAIDNYESLAAFKTLVRRNMFVAVGLLAIGAMLGIASFVLTVQLGLFGFMVVVLVATPLFLLGRSLKKLEVRARSLPCPNPQLDPEYRKVGHSWSSRLLPDF